MQAENLTWTQSPEAGCVSVLWFRSLFHHFSASVQYQSWSSSTLCNCDLQLFLCGPVSPARCNHRGEHPSVPGLPSSAVEALPVCDKRWPSNRGDATATPTIMDVGGGKESSQDGQSSRSTPRHERALNEPPEDCLAGGTCGWEGAGRGTTYLKSF